MKLPLYQIDAFTSEVFRGNPAAVCPLERWLPEPTLQSIAAENNLAETAFFVPRPGGSPGEYDLRWFTPVVEMDLCGHATLASAFLLFAGADAARDSVTFHTRSGPLTVRRNGEHVMMDFPARPPVSCAAPPGLAEALGRAPREVGKARDLMAVFDAEEEVRSITPNFPGILALGVHAVIVTAPGGDVDFVSRFFAPRVGVLEDPATGSSHCTLIPYWAKRLGKSRLRGRQLSARVGEFLCEDLGERVSIAGCAVQYLEGTIEV